MKRAGDGKGPRRRSKKEDDLWLATDGWEDVFDDYEGSKAEMEAEFLEAVRNGSVNIVRSFLDQGIDPTFTVLPKRETLLHVAVRFFTTDNMATEKIVRLLLFFGCDPNAEDCDGDRPLHVACRETSQTEECHCLIQMLLEAGADANAKNYNGHETPLLALCDTCHVCLDTVKLLVDHGADTLTETREGANALHMLSRANWDRPKVRDRVGVMTFLLKQGLPCNQGPRTPLHYELKSLICLLLGPPDTPTERLLPIDDCLAACRLLIVGGALSEFSSHEDLLRVLVHLMVTRRRKILEPFFLAIRGVLAPRPFERILHWIQTASAVSIRSYMMANDLNGPIADSHEDDDEDNHIDGEEYHHHQHHHDQYSHRYRGHHQRNNDDIVDVNDSHSVPNTNNSNSNNNNNTNTTTNNISNTDDDDDDETTAVDNDSNNHHLPVNHGDNANSATIAMDSNTATATASSTTTPTRTIDVNKLEMERSLRTTSPTPLPPSLVALSKLVVRGCMGGRVLYLTPLLQSRLPQKHCNYLMSL